MKNCSLYTVNVSATSIGKHDLRFNSVLDCLFGIYPVYTFGQSRLANNRDEIKILEKTNYENVAYLTQPSESIDERSQSRPQTFVGYWDIFQSVRVFNFKRKSATRTSVPSNNRRQPYPRRPNDSQRSVRFQPKRCLQC